MAGKTYKVLFWLMAEGDPTGTAAPNSFSFDWDGAPGAPALIDTGPFAYTQFQYLLTASSAATTLSFSFSDTPAFWDFDAVDVTVPEPGSLVLALGALAGLVASRRRAPAKSLAPRGAR